MGTPWYICVLAVGFALSVSWVIAWVTTKISGIQ